MTTASWSTRIRNDSDATYQEWRDELITKLALMSTYLTADETNITPGAGARAAINTEQGYAVYHLNDSIHASAPIYIRFGFGSGGSTSTPRLQVTLGTSTNGSGVIGGTALATILNIGTMTGAATTDTARQSYMCAHSGFFGLDFKIGTTSNGGGAFLVCRTCDGSGAPTALGAIARWGANGSAAGRTSMLRFTATANIWSSTASVDQQAIAILPLALVAASTVVGSDIQAALCTMYTPRIQPVFGLVGIFTPTVGSPEVAIGSTLSATPVGTTARTFLVMSTFLASVGPVRIDSGGGGLHPAMLWE